LNEIFYHSEKHGGPAKGYAQIDSFRDAFVDNGLFDLGYEGYDFTWNRWQNGEPVVEERLDCFYATSRYFSHKTQLGILTRIYQITSLLFLGATPGARHLTSMGASSDLKICGAWTHRVQTLLNKFRLGGVVMML